ncbi:hypothetical protein BGW80DRAFT_1264553 [Lactifluus volemus]|nr:hypothetical protein BGW80DRAFT_1264553 [Lactifluus volemus]
MKLSLAHSLSVLSLSAFTLAHSHHHLPRHQIRAPVSSTSTTSTSTGTSTTNAIASTGVPLSSLISSATTTSSPTVSVSLHSQNPTAVPLASIVANASSAPALPMPTAFSPGIVPSSLPQAPGLPDRNNLTPLLFVVSKLSASNYPPMDQPPPTDSPEVQQWIQDVINSGVQIPSFNPTTPGGCFANPDAVADSSRCWWTCGGCTRSTDVTTSYLEQNNLLSTFFVVGSRCLEFMRLLQKEYLDGHQIAVHTWSHRYLTTQSNEEIIAELGWTKKIIQDVTGVTPIYMRPPYGDIDDRVRAICEAMNLIPVIWTRVSSSVTFDTGDYYLSSGNVTAAQVINNWGNIVQSASTLNTGFIVLEHDLFLPAVEIATGYIIPDALAHVPPFNITPVINCIGLNLADAYVQTNDNTSHPLPVNPDAGGSGRGSSGKSKNGAMVGPVTNAGHLVTVAIAAVLGSMAVIP